jgi:FKBP-type peptidyl-prolyl cis-trans isomerase
MNKKIKKYSDSTIRPQIGDWVLIHYVGKCKDKMFDSSRRRNEPYKYVLGNAPISGWDMSLYVFIFYFILLFSYL